MTVIYNIRVDSLLIGEFESDEELNRYQIDSVRNNYAKENGIGVRGVSVTKKDAPI